MTMSKPEVYEEIRSLLREPQTDSVADPWNYTDGEIGVQVTSGLRNLRTMGVISLNDVTFTIEGGFNRALSEAEGIMLCLFVAQRLLSGDLVQKLLEGELGIYLNAGGDVIDTKTATRTFRETADSYQHRFDGMVAVATALTPTLDPYAAIFGGPHPYMA